MNSKFEMIFNPLTFPGEVVSEFTYPYLSEGAPAHIFLGGAIRRYFLKFKKFFWVKGAKKIRVLQCAYLVVN